MTGLGLVLLGAAAGAPLRWLAGLRWGRWGTATVNVVGSLLLGVLVGLAVPAGALLLLGVGFCGALTTFSTAAVEALTLWRDARLRAAGYVAGSLAAGVVAAAAGWALGAALA